jgi:hypothetical protein
VHENAPPLRQTTTTQPVHLNYPFFCPEKPALFGCAGSNAARRLCGNVRFGKSRQKGKGLMKPGGKQRNWPVSFKLQTDELLTARFAHFPDTGLPMKRLLAGENTIAHFASRFAPFFFKRSRFFPEMLSYTTFPPAGALWHRTCKSSWR